MLKRISRLHNADRTTVLITGESGTGKELVARAIHASSSRAKAPFIIVNCAAIPVDLLESQCFGYMRGAFTGAVSDHEGFFALADSGTLFLDEISEMPLPLQPKLLRVLEDGYVMPIGATTGKRVDVRIVAATNADLEERMKRGTFRQDLYYRLDRFRVKMPPLRERAEDIPLLAEHFLRLYAAEMAITPPALSPQAMAALLAHPFPGNVRELKNLIERALIECDGLEILPEHLGIDSLTKAPAESADAPLDLPLNLQATEILLIKRALLKAKGNVSAASRLLGVAPTTIRRKLAQAGVDLEEVAEGAKRKT